MALEQPVKVILSLFTGKKTNSKCMKGVALYDFPAIFLDEWISSEGVLVKGEKLNGVWGEFLWRDEVIEILEQDFMERKWEEYNFAEEVDGFRAKVIRSIIEFSDADYIFDMDERTEFFAHDDISKAVTLIAENKIWDDKTIKLVTPIIYKYKVWTDKATLNDDPNEVSITTHEEATRGGIDWFNPEIYYTDTFEKLEKANWKRFILPEFHAAVDKINLTHLKQNLKDELGRKFCPLGWQGEFLLKSSRYNFVVGSRRIGKTFFGGGYLALRQLMIPKQNIIFLVPTLKNHAVPAWQAMKSYLAPFGNIRMDKNDWIIENEDNGSIIRFVTAARGGISARGSAAHLLIVDEMAFVDEITYETTLPLVATTNGMVYGISTVNPETPKNYFYYNLVFAEIEMLKPEQSEYYARRVTLDENPFIPDSEKSKIKARATNIDLFNAEWMCVFMDKGSYNTENFWVIDEEPIEVNIDGRWKTFWKAEALDKTMNAIYTKFIIIHDGAKRKDKPGIIVAGVKSGGGIELVMAHYADGFSYWDQVDLIVEIEKMLGGSAKCDIVIDYGGAGIAVEEIFIQNKKRYPICVMFSGTVTEGRGDGGIYIVGKDLMKNKLRANLELGMLKGFSFMKHLRSEFEMYSDDGTESRKFGHHFDLLSCMYMLNRWCEKSGHFIKDIVSNTQARLEGDFDWMDAPPDEIMFHEDADPYERMAKFGR